jgi:hypothetical protein
MTTLRLAFIASAAAATLVTTNPAVAQKQAAAQKPATPQRMLQEQSSINAEGQTLTSSQGTWTLSKSGSTSAGYAVQLNGRDVGYAVLLTMNPDGYPVATHADGSKWVWSGSTFKSRE